MINIREQTVVAVCRQALGNKDGDDERVDCEDARHDDGDEGLLPGRSWLTMSPVHEPMVLRGDVGDIQDAPS